MRFIMNGNQKKRKIKMTDYTKCPEYLKEELLTEARIRPDLPYVKKTKMGYQVYIPSTKGYIPQGQPHKSQHDAEKDAESFLVPVTHHNLKEGRIIYQRNHPEYGVAKVEHHLDHKTYGDVWSVKFFGETDAILVPTHELYKFWMIDLSSN